MKTRTETTRDFELLLLESARGDSVPESARARVAAGLGLASDATSPFIEERAGNGAGSSRPGSAASGALLKATLAGCVGALGLMFWGAREQSTALVPAVLRPALSPAVTALAATSAPTRGAVAEAASAVVQVAAAKHRPAPRRTTRRDARATIASQPPNHRGDTLLEEVRQLDRARSDLDVQRFSLALAVLDDYERRFPSGQLALEAAVLRVSVLDRAGRLGAAKSLARRLWGRTDSGRYRAELARVLAR